MYKTSIIFLFRLLFAFYTMSIDTFQISSSSPNARTIRDVRGLVDGMQHRFPVDIWMSSEVEARGCDKFVIELIPITVAKVGDIRIDDLSEHLWDLVLPKIGNSMEHFDSVRFSNMKLMVRDHRRKNQSCPGCGETYQYVRFMQHLKTCSSGSVCVRCLKKVEGSMTEHKVIGLFVLHLIFVLFSETVKSYL